MHRPNTTGPIDGHAAQGLEDLASALARALTTAEVASVVFGHVLPTIGAVSGTLVLRNEAGDALELVGAVGLNEAETESLRRIPLDALTPAAEVVRTRRPVWVASLANDQTFPYLTERLTRFSAIVVLPLMLDDEATGALALAFAKERVFEPHERLLLTAMAAQCATALQRAAAFGREREGRDRLEMALQAANMGTWDWDLLRNSVTWSPQLERIHGVAAGAFGTNLDAYFAHLHPEDRARVRDAIEASIQTGDLHLEYRGLFPTGEMHWFEARGRLTRDATTGKAIALRGICMDVTARMQAEHAVREREEQFRTLADNISQLAWMADAHGWIYWYNQRWHEFTGATLEQMQGWGWTSILHPDHVDMLLTRIKACYERGESWEETFALRGKHDQYRWFLSCATPIRDEGGHVVRWLGTHTDITEQRWTEALLAGERNALELIARGAQTNIVLAELCRTVEQLADDGLVASILVLEGTRLRHGAAPSLPAAYTRAIDGVSIGPNVGSCGTAAFRGEQVVVSDIATDPLWADFRDLAMAHGLRACWSTPIRSIDDQVLGTFALYYREPRSPAAEHLRLAALVGRTAAAILERKRADDTRARLVAAEHAARRSAESSGRRLGLQYQLAELLAGAAPDSMPPVLPVLCQALGWDWGDLWSLDANGDALDCGAVCQARPGTLDVFEQASRTLHVRRGEGLIGRVWQSGEPTWLADVQNEPDFTRVDAASQVGLRSGVVLPLRVRRDVVGVMSFFSTQVRQHDPELMVTLVGIGDQVGQFLERRHAEETLLRQSALLELAPVAVAVRDAERRIIYWNPAAEALYGWTSSEARGQIGHHLLQTRFPTSLQAHEATLERDGGWEGELVRVHRDGHEVIVASRWLVVRNPRGAMQTLEISRDITEERKAEEERARLYESETRARAAAEAAINARDDFLAVVSHDLRNPLAAVSGNIQLMRRRMSRGEVPTADQLLERLDSIQRGVSALSRQVDELHDASLLQAGHQLDLRLQRTDLVALVGDYVRGLQNTSTTHRLHFTSSVGDLTATWDSARLERVLSNLVSNAIKYSPAGGDIDVQVSRDGEWAVLSVADTGLGIPAGDLPYVFERFRRASNVKDRIAGSGLGLAGSRDIVEQHGGTIGVESQEGHGSTFTVRLPLGTAPASAP